MICAPRSVKRRLRTTVTALAILSLVGTASVVAAAPAFATTRPAVTGMSRHHGVYWGGTEVIVHGQDFTDVTAVTFGQIAGYDLQVLSATKLLVRTPYGRVGMRNVRVVTTTGHSRVVPASRFSYRYPTMGTPIFGGLSARQEQHISKRVRSAHHGVRLARRAHKWTEAMGRSALRRAKSWLGLPYSWAGGAGNGPTTGVCAHNGGDNDCRVVGFDCSGLTLYSWWPYVHLDHYAATQHRQAGRFHPSIGQLMPGDLVFFSGYVPDGIGHVAVYAGHGMVIEAAQSGTLLMKSRLADVIAESGYYRGATRPVSRGRQGPGPSVQSITRQVSANGGNLVITGSRLRSTTTVTIGRTTRYNFVKRTNTRLIVNAPARHAGTAKVTISNAWGSRTRSLTYVAAPRQLSLTPATGPTTGGTAVTITGRHLTGALSVTVGGKKADFTVTDARHLAVTTPKHAAGTVDVLVRSAFGTSNPQQYAYTAPAPHHKSHRTATRHGSARRGGRPG